MTKSKKLESGTAIDICGDNLWIGDKHGSLLILDPSSLDEKHKIEKKHSKAITRIAANGKLVASGDAYRYVKVWNNEDFSELFEHAEHKDKITDLYMTNDVLVSTTLDFAYGITMLADKKFAKQVKLPHQERQIYQAVMLGQEVVT